MLQYRDPGLDELLFGLCQFPLNGRLGRHGSVHLQLKHLALGMKGAELLLEFALIQLGQDLALPHAIALKDVRADQYRV